MRAREDSFPEYRVGAFQDDDLEQILAIERSAFGRPWSKRQFEEEVGAPFSTFLVVRSTKGSVAGYILWRLVSGELQVFNVAVAEERRRTGLGRHLLQVALEHGRRGGAVAATLEVQADNQAAVAFYRVMGFAEVGRRRHYYGRNADALLLEMALAAAPQT